MVQPTRKQETQATQPQQKEKVYKRTSKKMSPQQKEKIRQSLRSYYATHKRDTEWRKRISDGCKAYWSHFSKEDTEIEDLI